MKYVDFMTQNDGFPLKDVDFMTQNDGFPTKSHLIRFVFEAALKRSFALETMNFVVKAMNFSHQKRRIFSNAP